MRGLLRFIYKYRAFELFMLLEIIGIWLLIQNNRYYKISYLSSSNALVANLNQKVFNTQKYFGLREVNELLADENTFLREELSKYLYINKFVKLNTNDSLFNKFSLTPANVEKNSTARKNNYILLDKGRNHQIEPGMGVIGPEGVIGQIKYVSSNFSTAVSLLHTDIRVSSKITRDNTIGTIQWDGKNARIAKLKFIPRHVPIAIGDTIVTSGYNSVYPENIPVGFIKEIEIIENESFYNIDVILSTSFTNLNMTYIVRNNHMAEIDSLINATEE